MTAPRTTRRRPRLAGGLVTTLLIATAAAAHPLAALAAAAGKTDRASVSSAEVQGNGASTDPAISGDGRYVAFTSDATDLVAGDTNGRADVFVRDRSTGTTILASVAASGKQGNGASFAPLITRQGRRVVFGSLARNLTPDESTARADLFLRDLQAATTTLVSIGPDGRQFTSGNLGAIAIAEDARYVAFSIVHPGGGTAYPDEVYVRDTEARKTTLESRSDGGQPSNGAISGLSISGDGRYVAFQSDATSLVAGTPGGGVNQIYLRDRKTDRISVVSVTPDGRPTTGQASRPLVSADGRYVAFTAAGPGLAPGVPEDNLYRVYLRDITKGETTLVDVFKGKPGVNSASLDDISGDGRYLLLTTGADLVGRDDNAERDLYVFDRLTGTSQLASARANGNAVRRPNVDDGRISYNGRFVAFASTNVTYVGGDTNGVADVFVRQLAAPASR